MKTLTENQQVWAELSPYSGPHKYRNHETLIFQNYEIDVTEDWEFTKCGKVVFENCVFKGSGNNTLILQYITDFQMTNCSVSGFHHCFAEMKAIKSFSVKQCYFADCSRFEDYYGCVFDFDDATNIVFSGNKFNNCSVNSDDCGAVAFLAPPVESLTITDNEFVDCKGGSLFFYIIPLDNIPHKIVQNNTFRNSCENLLE